MSKDALNALVKGRHSDPFALLGLHKSGTTRVVRAFQPHASKVELVDVKGQLLADMERVHPEGLFEASLPPRIRHYRLRISIPGKRTQCRIEEGRNRRDDL